MLLRSVVVSIFLPGLMMLGAGLASGQIASTGSGQAASTSSGQAYPNKPIRIVTAASGGALDIAARLVAQGLTAGLGQQVIVDNRAGIGAIAIEIVAKAPPDGYTLLVHSNGMWTLPLIQDVLYDPVRDFLPVTLAVSTPSILVVHPSLPIKSVKELIVLAKAKPKELNYASGPAGSSIHLAAELFTAMAGVNIVRVPYKGSAQGLNDLIAGQVQLMFPTAASVSPHVKSGRLRALAVTSTQPSSLFPGLPTVGATVPGYESISMIGMFAPAGTPAALINRLNQETARVLNQANVKEKFFNTGSESVASSPEQFAAKIKSEMARLGKIIKGASIRGE